MERSSMNSQTSILETIIDYSLELTYLLRKRKLKKKTLYDAFVTKNNNILFENILPVGKKHLDHLKQTYSKWDCFDEILYLTENHYEHLKKIRYLVDITEMVETTIPESLYQEKLKLHYADFLLDQLVETFYDSDSIKRLGKLKQKLIEKDLYLQTKITKNIDRYYMRKIMI